jgi:hypothetical protein
LPHLFCMMLRLGRVPEAAAAAREILRCGLAFVPASAAHVRGPRSPAGKAPQPSLSRRVR